MTIKSQCQSAKLKIEAKQEEAYQDFLNACDVYGMDEESSLIETFRGLAFNKKEIIDLTDYQMSTNKEEVE